jgi:hypothetical protein
LGSVDIEWLFDALSAELGGRGGRGEIFLVGGAALAVALDPRRSTRDLDAVLAPTDHGHRAVHAVAEDIALLYRHLGYTSVDQGMDLVRLDA